jgi:hypothetical protein
MMVDSRLVALGTGTRARPGRWWLAHLASAPLRLPAEPVHSEVPTTAYCRFAAVVRLSPSPTASSRCSGRHRLLGHSAAKVGSKSGSSSIQ